MSTFWQRLHVSSIAESAHELACRYNTGLELTHFCDSSLLDEEDGATFRMMMRDMEGVDRFVLHSPFSEIFPCALDPKARQLAMERLQQAYQTASRAGVCRMVVHSGFLPNVYVPEWHMEQSAIFWREFLADKPDDFQLLVENVLDTDPVIFADMVNMIDDSRAKACLDIGHAKVYSAFSPLEWLEHVFPVLGHVHLHDNDGRSDLHLPLGAGVLPIKEILLRAEAAAPSYTLEIVDAEPSLLYLKDFWA